MDYKLHFICCCTIIVAFILITVVKFIRLNNENKLLKKVVKIQSKSMFGQESSCIVVDGIEIDLND